MFRAILPFLKQPIALGLPEGRNLSELFQHPGTPNIDRVEFADAPGKSWEPIEMNAEDSCLPVECGRPIKSRIALEHDFDVFDYEARICPLQLDLSGFGGGLVNDTLARLEAIPKPYVALSFHGASSPARKDCGYAMAEWICEAVYSLGFTPVVINYGNDRVYNFASNGRIIQTIGWPMTATSLWHLLDQSSYFIGIDSGPLHMALTIPKLECLFIRNRIDFMRFFYDFGLHEVRGVLDVAETKTQTIQKVKALCSKEEYSRARLVR